MSHNRSLGTLGAVLLVIVTVILAVVPGAWAQRTYKTLHKFTVGVDGEQPYAGVIFDQAGNLYGTTWAGGGGSCSGGCGVVFELTPNSDGSWSESVLYSFCSVTNCADGAGPNAGVIFDAAGNLYGTTYYGGGGNCTFGGCGTVFKLSPGSGGWTETVLYTFCSLTNCVDGADPTAGLIFDGAGNLYGTARGGGIAGCVNSYDGCGVAFELMPQSGGSWTETVLHSFNGENEGGNPQAGLIFDTAGNLYGTTLYGGGKCSLGCGAVFKLSPGSGGWTGSVLHSFTGGKDGANPSAGLIFDAAGNLYGTTTAGGPSYCSGYGCGVVFELTPTADGSWKERVLHHFTGGRDGGEPTAGLIFGPTGNLYGTTLLWGHYGNGVVFKLALNSEGEWFEAVLHAFVDHPAAQPFAGLIADAAGNLYGTTRSGIANHTGVVFEITP